MTVDNKLKTWILIKIVANGGFIAILLGKIGITKITPMVSILNLNGIKGFI